VSSQFLTASSQRRVVNFLALRKYFSLFNFVHGLTLLLTRVTFERFISRQTGQSSSCRRIATVPEIPLKYPAKQQTDKNEQTETEPAARGIPPLPAYGHIGSNPTITPNSTKMRIPLYGIGHCCTGWTSRPFYLCKSDFRDTGGGTRTRTSLS